jgi:outer membrane protein assembly factor BamE (lipoprotein component of BamABCDE complex)
MFSLLSKFSLLSLIALVMISCSPVERTHGYVPRADELDSIQAGQDTRGSVQRKLGRPSTVGSFDDNKWYYISRKTKQYSFFKPENVEQKIVAISFDDNGLVDDVNQYGLEDGRVIDLVTRTTPTFGRELTVLQQMFGNIGRFNASNLGSDTPGLGDL